MPVIPKGITWTDSSAPRREPSRRLALRGPWCKLGKAMTLGEALRLVQERKNKRRRKLFLVCGFEPLHLGTFVEGHLALRFPDEGADIRHGLYGDLEGTVQNATASDAEGAVVVIEWSDLDARLGLRSARRIGSFRSRGHRRYLPHTILPASRWTGSSRRQDAVALVPPTLPFSLVGYTAGWQASETELELRKQLATFLADAARSGGVAVLDLTSLARVSPELSRLDALMELRAGFPYTVAHASAVAEMAVKLLFPPAPMKGLITDLDETLWSGIVGEAGPRGVSWSLAEGSQIHGLYQQMLGHLAEMGVLLAAASKNELGVVEEALRREDLLVPAKSIFPIGASWRPKSESVAEILRTWNIGAESVVFIDDSAMELDEVRTAFSAMTCLQFSKKQPAKTVVLLQQLRDLFGKPAVHREDILRQASIRSNAAVQAGLAVLAAANSSAACKAG